nr:DUF4158 domain-containing protein [Streptomyces sp. MRC013]
MRRDYTERLKTAYEHAWEIRDAYGYHQFKDHGRGRTFGAFTHGRAWTAHAEGPKASFDHAVGWLRGNRVPLPGASVLARQVAEVRTLAEKRLHTAVAKAARRADAALPGDLVALSKAPEGKRYPYPEQLRRPPTRTTGTAMKNALQRVDEIAASQPVDGLRPLRGLDTVHPDDDDDGQGEWAVNGDRRRRAGCGRPIAGPGGRASDRAPVARSAVLSLAERGAREEAVYAPSTPPAPRT